jgi:large subunit ribosomal protein L7/L12
MSKVQEVIDIVKGLTVLELSELVKALEEEFGVSAAAPVAVAAAPAAAAAAVEEEQTEFDVILASVGDKKINVIRSSEKSPVSVLKKPKTWLMQRPNRLKKKLTKRSQ